jgi:hypothetical protein
VAQLVVLLTVAVFFGLCLQRFNISLFYSIPLGILLQFGVNYAFLTILDAWIALKDKKLENERIKEFSLQGLEVTCPCSLKKTEFVPITLNTNNTYKCNHCQKNISVYIVPETALITEPLVMPQVPNIPASTDL